MTRRASHKRRRAFTLLEVMVAIAILGISLTALFSSEAGAIRMASRARKTSLASLLARCKMNEVEEKVAKEGLPAVFANGSDECCEDAEIEGFTCDWEIQPIVLPETMFAADEEAADGMGAPAADDKASLTDSLSGADPAQMLAGAADGSMFSTMAMQMAFPILKPAFEQQIRRATVTVRWKEGTGEHSFDVTQYLVAEQALAELGAQNAGEGTDTEGNGAGGTDPATGQPATTPQVNGLGLPGMPR